MKLITHPLADGSAACVCVSTYDERHIPAQAGFTWNQIVPKAWATTRASVAAKLWMHADEVTIKRLLKAGVITQDQHDQRITALAEAARFNNPRETKRDRAEELAIRLASQPALIEAIHFMLRFMASRCDGAVEEDGVGFNGTDTDFGHQLAASATLSPKQAAYGQIMLWKYMGQIGHLPEFDLVYGAEAEAERQRMAEAEAQKLKARMAGKLCKAHGRQITFLAKSKRVGFCDECKPADPDQPAATNQALADAGLPTIEAAAWVPEGAVVMVPTGAGASPEGIVVAIHVDAAGTPITELTLEEYEKDKPRFAENQPPRPVDAAVALLQATGLGDLIDPAKVEAARQFADQAVDGWMAAADATEARLNASEEAAEGAGSPPEASEAVQGQQAQPEAIQRAVADLLVAENAGTDALWTNFQMRHDALKVLAQDVNDEQLNGALDRALAVAAQLAKAEAKAGNLITAARR